MLVFMVCAVRRNLCVFSLYRNPDVPSQIFYYLLTSMAAVQAEDLCATFCLWVILMTIINSGWVLRVRIVMALQPLSTRPMHVLERLIELRVTDVPIIVQVSVLAPR